MKQINEIFKELREDNDLKQSYVGGVLGISQQSYSNYETGEYELPIRHLKTLSTFYNVSADYLLGISEYKATSSQLNEIATGNLTFGKLISDIMALDDDNKKAVAEYMELLKLKQKK